ncbi:MAG: zinc finger protein [Methanomassiliicoccales archaeon]
MTIRREVRRALGIGMLAVTPANLLIFFLLGISSPQYSSPFAYFLAGSLAVSVAGVFLVIDYYASVSTVQPPAVQRPKPALCPVCGAIVFPDRVDCEVCGSLLFRKCPSCGLLNRGTSPVCSRCGAEL